MTFVNLSYSVDLCNAKGEPEVSITMIKAVDLAMDPFVGLKIQYNTDKYNHEFVVEDIVCEIVREEDNSDSTIIMVLLEGHSYAAEDSGSFNDVISDLSETGWEVSSEDEDEEEEESD